jgi:hypothetical protein
MLTSNTMIPMITFFLKWIKDASPSIRPVILMTDHNQAQITALQTVYPQSQVLLCTWHVLHTMWSYFATNEFPDLWDNIKAWVKTNNLTDFFQSVGQDFNQSLCPTKFGAISNHRVDAITPYVVQCCKKKIDLFLRRATWICSLRCMLIYAY